MEHSIFVQQETRGVFEIELRTAEDTPDYSDWCAESAAMTARGLETGELECFTACVIAKLDGVVLAENYLGGCVYEDADTFVRESGYYDDMVDTVIAEARERVARMVELLNSEGK